MLFPYDLGWYENVKVVMGKYPLTWLLPQSPNGDGFSFEHEAGFEDGKPCGRRSALISFHSMYFNKIDFLFFLVLWYII